MPTQIWHGSYGAESPYDVESLRYASTDCEDLDQGFIELLRVLDGPPQLGAYVVHSFLFLSKEERAERIVVTLRSRAEADEAYKLVSNLWHVPAADRPRAVCGAPVEYLRGAEFPWVYAERVPDQLSLL